MEAVAQLIKEGKVRYAGVSNYTAAQMEEACKYVDVISNQVPYSMIKRDIESTLVPWCLANQKSILAYSPLERGILTGKIKPGHVFAEGDHRAKLYYFRDENIIEINDFLSRIKHIADSKNI